MIKYSAFVFLGLLLLGCGRNQFWSKKSSSQNQRIMLEFNRLDNGSFGILTKNVQPFSQIVELKNDSFAIECDSFKVFLTRKNMFVDFVYIEEGYKSTGRFILPKYYCVASDILFDPETTFTKKITVTPYFDPVRNGDWFFWENNNVKKINYNIDIDDSALNKLSRFSH